MRRYVPVLLALAVLGGCTYVKPETPVEQGPTAAEIRAMDDRAGAALTTFATVAVEPGRAFLPVGEPFGQLGSWEPRNAGYATSLAGLWVITDSTLGAASPAPAAKATVVWADGATADLPMLSARDAYEFPAAPAVPCLNCSDLRLSDAVLGRMTLATTHGPAVVPIWEYTVDGSTVRLTRPAVAMSPVTVPELPQPSGGVPFQLPVSAARGSVTALDLTAVFTGALFNGDQPCGDDYAAEALESPTAVVLVLHQVRRLNKYPDAACVLVGRQRTVTVTLHQPLGERTVLDGVSGQPVPAVRTP